MAEEIKDKPVAKKTVAKKPDAAAPAMAEQPAAVSKLAASQTPVKSGATVTVTRTGSDLGRPAWAKQTLIGLGLAKTHRTRTLEDTPAVRGMINRVKHLVRVEDPSKQTKSKTGT